MKRSMLALAAGTVAACATVAGSAMAAVSVPSQPPMASPHERSREPAAPSQRQVEPSSPAEQEDNLAPVARAPGRDLYRITYVGGEPAEVEIESRGPTALALHVYDDSRKLVCRSADPGSVQRCRWSPSSTAPYWIEVRNDTGSDLAYRLRTN